MQGEIVPGRGHPIRRRGPSDDRPLEESSNGTPLKFRFDLDLDSLTAATWMELNYTCRMAFETEEQKKTFFQRAESDPTSVAYGTALSHARSIIGLWLNEDLIYEDCARIMACELRRALIELKTQKNITAEEVMGSSVFREVYNVMRTPKKAAIHNLVRALGDNMTHMDYKRVQPEGDLQEKLRYLHPRVLIELGKVRVPQDVIDKLGLPERERLLGDGHIERRY